MHNWVLTVSNQSGSSGWRTHRQRLPVWSCCCKKKGKWKQSGPGGWLHAVHAFSWFYSFNCRDSLYSGKCSTPILVCFFPVPLAECYHDSSGWVGTLLLYAPVSGPSIQYAFSFLLNPLGLYSYLVFVKYRRHTSIDVLLKDVNRKR